MMLAIKAVGAFLFGSVTGILIVAGIASAIVGSAYLKGRSDYKAICVAAAAVERERQTKINLDAIADANERADALNKMVDALQDELRKVQDEADKDPGAAAGGIGADSVQRIDRIR